MPKQDLTLTQSLKPETVAEMLTRTAAHYPNSGHTRDTLKIVAEDWFHTFNGKLTDRAFVEGITLARRSSKFFPTEAEIFKSVNVDPEHECKVCSYFNDGNCANIKKAGFNTQLCTSFISTLSRDWRQTK